MEMTSIKEEGSVIAMEDQLSWVGLTDRQKQHTNPLLRRDGKKESLLTNEELVQWMGHCWKSEIEHAITLDTYLKKCQGTAPAPTHTPSHTPPNLTNKCFPTLQSVTGQVLRDQSETIFFKEMPKNSRKRPLRKKQFRPFSEFENELPSTSLYQSPGESSTVHHTTKRQSQVKSGLTGLKGGGNETMVPQNSLGLSSQLKLENPYATNACFINSSVQLFALTGYAHHISGLQTFQEDQKICKALYDIYTGKEDSTKKLRQLMAFFTKKEYYDNRSQQDSVEFLEDLEAALFDEVGLNSIRDLHWGSEELTRHFLGNEDGRCPNGHMPDSMNQEFLFLKLRVKYVNSKVTIQSLIDQHFSSNMDMEQIKCGQCCQCSNQTPPIVCTFSGNCEVKSAMEKCVFTMFPKYLFIQIIRWDKSGQKVDQFVQIAKELFISDSCTYQPTAIISHEGESKDSGHYITHRKNENEEWICCNDTQITSSSLSEANSKNNYIILFQMTEKDVIPDSVVQDLLVNENEGKDYTKNIPIKIHPSNVRAVQKFLRALVI